MRPVDVVVLTKNNEHLLDKCLSYIYENVPVKNLIIVDGCSTDDTMKIVKNTDEKHGNIRILNVNGSRAKAREAGICQVKTDWFMFVDSDVILSRGWLERAEKSVKKDVGAVL